MPGLRYPVTGELCPHHIALTDEFVSSFDTNANEPPLRAREDVEALIEGVADGTITLLGSDHATCLSLKRRWN
jgi:dihydroorotase